MRVFYTAQYYADIGPGHIFPIRKFELVFLEITRGAGNVRRIEPPVGTRVSDALREVVFRVLR